MSLRISYYISQLKSSFWFVPAAIISLGILLATLMLYLDYHFPFEPDGVLELIFSKNAASGRNVLTIIAGAMAGIAGTVFSITLVVLQLASSQLGPRLMENFMYKRINQVVLGQYIGLFLYCILIINSIREYDEMSFIPNYSVLGAILLAAFNVFLLVIYIHEVSTSIQPSKIIFELRNQIESGIRSLYPDPSQAGTKQYEKVEDDHLKPIGSICCEESGYIQFFALDTLSTIARETDIVVYIQAKPGEFLVRGQNVLEIRHEDGNRELSEEEINRLRGAFQLFRKKSFFQDTEYAIQQIVEIASKALSPGINDPNTAIYCIDHLTSCLALLTTLNIGENAVMDEESGKLLIYVGKDSFEGYLKASFDEIRQFGAASPSVIIRLMESVHKIHDADERKIHSEVLRTYATLIWETGQESFMLKADLKDLENRYRKISR